MQRTMSFRSRGVGMCVAIVVAQVSIAQNPGVHAMVPIPPHLFLAGDATPLPPEQSVEWKPPETKLPKEFVLATDTLFRQGLADPRGCEYREIEVLVGGSEPPWSDKIVKTHGWVIPDTGTKAQRFGVCWNGLVYPVASIGKPADLRADALMAAKAKVEGALVGTGRTWVANYEDFCLCHPSEERSVSYESPLPIKACLLLRLGEAELAERVWNRWTSGLRSYSSKLDKFLTIEESVEPNKPILRDPYLVLANCWTLALFDRAEAAHMRSDDRLALASVEMLNTLWPAAKTEAEKRGFREPSPKGDASAPYFLIRPNRVQELLADQRRRAEDRTKGTQPPVLSGQYHDPEPFFKAIAKRVGQFPDKKSRIAFLLHELEEASQETCAPVASNSGAFYAERNVLVSFLIEQGEDAVEPLLTCLESDNRLSRFQRREERYPLGVYRFAEIALPEILKVPFHDFDDDHPERDKSQDRQAVAARIGAYWERYKGLPAAERWYGVLADDQAPPYQWLAAARAIIQPTSVPVSLDSVTQGWERDWWRPNSKRAMHGEALRKKSNPSVAELIAKRVKMLNGPYPELLAKRRKMDEKIEGLTRQMEKLNEPEISKLNDRKVELETRRDELVYGDNQDWWTPFQKGCDMAFCLAQWDHAASVKILHDQTDLCRQAMADSDDQSTSKFNETLAQILRVSADLGDQAALDELRNSSTKPSGKKP